MGDQRRIGVISDISCVGRCSATAALPIYAVAGIHGNVIPTALFSTQTGGYTGYTYRDLSEDMMGIVRHFKELDLKFDLLYTGYLTGEEQIEMVMEAVDILDARKLIVDPVMGNDGSFYNGFSNSYCEKMKDLCKKADIIVPNLTEACFLTGYEYGDGVVDEPQIEEIFERLKEFGMDKIIITGVRKKDDYIGMAVMDGKREDRAFYKEVEGVYHGAGDVFGAALACGMAYDCNFVASARTAHIFTYMSILKTKSARTDTREGLNFEECLKIITDVYNGDNRR